MRTASPAGSGARSSRSGAGDGEVAALTVRQRPAKTGRPSTATCRRRKARASISVPGQARMPAKPPQASNCSRHQGVWRSARMTIKRSGTRPAAAQAGACGSQGGATRASQPPSADRRASAGKSRLISPKPLPSARNSTRLPRGQPPPGSSASSSGWPLGMAGAGKLASVSPRQTSPRASTSARASGDGTALMTGC